MHPVAIIPKICTDESLYELPIVAFIAGMIARMYDRAFSPETFRISKDGTCITLVVAKRISRLHIYGGDQYCFSMSPEIRLDFRTYAYQVKLVMDAITEAGYFS